MSYKWAKGKAFIHMEYTIATEQGARHSVAYLQPIRKEAGATSSVLAAEKSVGDDSAVDTIYHSGSIGTITEEGRGVNRTK